MTDQHKPPGTIGTGYPGFMLAKALITAEEHADKETRELALKKIEKWARAINAMLSGEVTVGSRTPVKDTPKWVTLEVVTGGFATGAMLAGGELQDHELKLLSELKLKADQTARLNLNAHFLTEAGQARLQAMLRKGTYQVNVPEEGVLLVVAWLSRHGGGELARDLIETVTPLMDRLRFYPAPGEQTANKGLQVYLQPVKQTVAAIQRIKPNQRVLAQNEAVLVWAPLYDRVIGLLIETMEGDQPCRIFPEGWCERAEQTLADYDLLRREHTLCKRPDKPGGSFAQVRKYLRKCIDEGTAQSDRDVARIGQLITRYVAKRGAPDSDECRRLRSEQAGPARAPLHYEIAKVVLTRLESYPQGQGLSSIDPVVQPVTADEAKQYSVPEQTLVPQSQGRKVSRSRIDTVDALIDDSVITSGETLARVLPQISSELKSIGIADQQLRKLYSAIYRAFSRRRSLLLLNYESQVKLEELPWVAAMEQFRSADLTKQEVVRQTLEEVSATVISAFPHAILPSKLIQEFRALAIGAGLELPLTEEVAADIFMGGFTVKYREAAMVAALLLKDTLYDRYYSIGYTEIMPMLGAQPPTGKSKSPLSFLKELFSIPTPVAGQFSALCEKRSGVSATSGVPAQNGMVIEQQQILTTHNLAVIYFALGLESHLSGKLVDLAKDCFKWVCWRLTIKVPKYHAKLVSLKNSAYAWRQMVFYLALAEEREQQEFLAWANEYLIEQPAQFRSAFKSVLRGLVLAMGGLSLDQLGDATDARVLLGWSAGGHWFLEHDCM